MVDDLSTGREENLTSALEAGAELTVASVTDAGSMERVVEEYEPETVFHLAAQVDVRRAVREPAYDAVVNVIGTVALLEGRPSCGRRTVRPRLDGRRDLRRGRRSRASALRA